MLFLLLHTISICLVRYHDLLYQRLLQNQERCQKQIPCIQMSLFEISFTASSLDLYIWKPNWLGVSKLCLFIRSLLYISLSNIFGLSDYRDVRLAKKQIEMCHLSENLFNDFRSYWTSVMSDWCDVGQVVRQETTHL